MGKNLKIEVVRSLAGDDLKILTPDALAFIDQLIQKFSKTRTDLLEKRKEIQKLINAGQKPQFLNEMADIRSQNWKVAPVPKDLQDRKVEITGPASSRKMVINALNSGAKVYMADAEDSETPTWNNLIQGQINLKDTVDGTITFSGEGKEYKLNSQIATLMFRPRGWHLSEKHVLYEGNSISASLFDFGLYFFHNAKKLMQKGSGPYFYLPKMENHHEARLWNDVFNFSEDYLKIPKGSIKATVLLETILAAFEMEEILYELREHSAGLNCGRWDYIFSYIKKFSASPEYLLPDRALITMDKGFLASYVQRVIQICHKRGAHAMGGMAAQIPIKNNSDENEKAITKVKADKLREVKAGHDGTWVAHPGLVGIALEIFNEYMPTANQIDLPINNVQISAADLIKPVVGEITEKGLRINIEIGIRYLESWLRGVGCVPLNNLMEDAATAEISRAQVWQWLKHEAPLSNGQKVNKDLVQKIFDEEMQKIETELGKIKYTQSQFTQASQLFLEMIFNKEFPEFLTLAAYQFID